MIYAYLIGFTLIFGYYNAWQWTDDQDGVHDTNKAKPKWKGASMVLRAIAYSSPVLFSLTAFSYFDYALALAICFPVFDLTINIVRGMPVFYLGKTSKMDRIGGFKWVAYAALIAAIIALKQYL